MFKRLLDTFRYGKCTECGAKTERKLLTTPIWGDWQRDRLCPECFDLSKRKFYGGERYYPHTTIFESNNDPFPPGRSKVLH